MSDERAKWINEVAGDYIENWVAELIAAEWQKEVVNLQSRIAELDADRSKAWETCQKAVERGMALEAKSVMDAAELAGNDALIAGLKAENKRLREAAKSTVDSLRGSGGLNLRGVEALRELQILLESNSDGTSGGE